MNGEPRSQSDVDPAVVQRVGELRRLVSEGADAIALARWLQEVVPGLRPFTFIAQFFMAFDFPLQQVIEADEWVGFGWDPRGSMTDEAFLALLSPLRPKPGVL